MASKRKTWSWVAAAVAAALVLGVVMMSTTASSAVSNGCPGSQVYCAGVGCVSGEDKCVAGNKGGPSAVFSKETFASWPGAGHESTPPNYSKESFTPQCRSMRPCPGGTRTDGPCLMDFPEF